MKIGQFSDSFLPIIDGVGRVVYNYCEMIANKGHECTIIAPLDKFGYRGKFPFEIIDYYAKKVPIMSSYDAGLPAFDLHYNARLDMTDFDIVHVHTPFISGHEGIKYAKDRNVPIVGTFHSKYYDDFLQLTGSKTIASIGTDVVVNFYNHCDEVWAVSENSALTLASYGFRGNINIMPNGMMIKELNPSWARLAKEHFNLNDDPVLLFVGQQNWKKNILRVMEACALLNKEGVRFNLVLAGKGPHEDEITAKAKELGIDNQTHQVGHILKEDLLSGLYMYAKLFVFPSLYDNAPMVVREAANAGTPSIVVEKSSSAEIIEDGINGFTCKDDSEDLCRVIKDALNNENLEQIGINAKNTIPQSWDEIIDIVLEHYQNLIDKRKGLL